MPPQPLRRKGTSIFAKKKVMRNQTRTPAAQPQGISKVTNSAAQNNKESHVVASAIKHFTEQSEDNVKDTIKDTAKDTAKDTVKDAAKDAAKDTVKPTVKPIVKAKEGLTELMKGNIKMRLESRVDVGLKVDNTVEERFDADGSKDRVVGIALVSGRVPEDADVDEVKHASDIAFDKPIEKVFRSWWPEEPQDITFHRGILMLAIDVHGDHKKAHQYVKRAMDERFPKEATEIEKNKFRSPMFHKLDAAAKDLMANVTDEKKKLPRAGPSDNVRQHMIEKDVIQAKKAANHDWRLN